MTIADFENLFLSEKFGLDECGDLTPQVEDAIDQVMELNTNFDNFEWKFGATKLVFLFKDFVIKLPFNGTYWYTDEHYTQSEFNEFIVENYCEIESTIYADAIVAGVDKFFASTRYAGRTKSGICFYKSERVNEFRYGPTASPQAIQQADTVISNHNDCDIDYNWLSIAIDYYGIDEVENLMNFIEEENINDLHSGNVGFRADGSPVILDYSGYNEY